MYARLGGCQPLAWRFDWGWSLACMVTNMEASPCQESDSSTALSPVRFWFRGDGRTQGTPNSMGHEAHGHRETFGMVIPYALAEQGSLPFRPATEFTDRPEGRGPRLEGLSECQTG